jgi:hypothetical protein
LALNDHLLIYKEDTAKSTKYLQPSYFVKSSISGLKFDKILDGIMVKEFSFTDGATIYSSTIFSALSANISECHPNCAKDKCFLNDKLNHFRAQECTQCSTGVKLQVPLGCTRTLSPNTQAKTLNGFVADHKTLTWTADKKLQICKSTKQSSSNNLLYIILFSSLIFFALIGLAGVLAFEMKKSKVLTQRLAKRRLAHSNEFSLEETEKLKKKESAGWEVIEEVEEVELGQNGENFTRNPLTEIENPP